MKAQFGPGFAPKEILNGGFRLDVATTPLSCPVFWTNEVTFGYGECGGNPGVRRQQRVIERLQIGDQIRSLARAVYSAIALSAPAGSVEPSPPGINHSYFEFCCGWLIQPRGRP
jgi:hypothetical protein